jgi:acyl carrier protein
MRQDGQLRDIIETIKHILISDLEVPPAVLAESGPATPLLGRGIGLDSVEAMALATGLEMEFDIEIGDEDLTVDLFQSFATLAEYVLQKVAK